MYINIYLNKIYILLTFLFAFKISLFYDTCFEHERVFILSVLSLVVDSFLLV